MNRIEDEIIASVLLEEIMKSEAAADMVASKIRQRLEINGYGKLPQPLTDEELRDAVAERLYFIIYPNGYGGVWKNVPEDVKEHWRFKADQIRPLLQPKIEEAEKRGIDTAIKAYESTCEALIVEAVKKERERILGKDRPRVICLCGSTRFVDTFNEWRKRLTLEGCIVVSIELVLPQSEREDPQHANYKVKQMLDELHLRKIDLADEVMILNVGGYIGNSTRAEIEYAGSKGKSIKYLEALKKGKSK